jgi:putative ABC transport system permease protein
VKIGNSSFNENITMVDSTIFKMFDFKLLEGNRENPFPQVIPQLLHPLLQKNILEIQVLLGKGLKCN